MLGNAGFRLTRQSCCAELRHVAPLGVRTRSCLIPLLPPKDSGAPGDAALGGEKMHRATGVAVHALGD